MADKDTFKIAFLSAYGKMGLSTSEAIELTRELRERVKTAAEDLQKDADLASILGAGGAAMGLGRSVLDAGAAGVGHLGSAAKWGLGLGLGVPLAAGVAAGVGTSKATDIDDDDMEAAKIHELINEYQQNADRLRRNRRVYRLPTG